MPLCGAFGGVCPVTIGAFDCGGCSVEYFFECCSSSSIFLLLWGFSRISVGVAMVENGGVGPILKLV